MDGHPIRTTVIGSYPFPSWLELAMDHPDALGEADREEMIDLANEFGISIVAMEVKP